jgi:hypothetical protein
MSMIPIGTFGDVNPIRYGGGILYKDGDSYRAVHFDPTDEPDPDDECDEDDEDADCDGDGRLIVEVRSFDVEDNVITDLSWLDNKDWDGIADSISIDADDLRELATDPDPRVRLQVYQSVAGYWGWDNLDHYPDRMRADELEKRYGDDIEAAHAYQANRRRGAAENPTSATDPTPRRTRAPIIAARLARGES